MLKVQTRNFPKTKRAIDNYNFKVRSSAQKSFDKGLSSILVPEIKSNIIKNGNVYTRTLLNNIRVINATQGGEVAVEVVARKVNYLRALEFGQTPKGEEKPTPVSYDKILAYVKKKNGLTGEAAEKMAKRVLFVIRKYGTKPHPIVRPAFATTKHKLIAYIQQYMKSELT